jgi:hypothetical protein
MSDSDILSRMALISPAAAAAMLSFLDERLDKLVADLKEAERYGVNTPGFNQTLGARHELELLTGIVEHAVTNARQ